MVAGLLLQLQVLPSKLRVLGLMTKQHPRTAMTCVVLCAWLSATIGFESAYQPKSFVWAASQSVTSDRSEFNHSHGRFPLISRVNVKHFHIDSGHLTARCLFACEFWPLATARCLFACESSGHWPLRIAHSRASSGHWPRALLVRVTRCQFHQAIICHGDRHDDDVALADQHGRRRATAVQAVWCTTVQSCTTGGLRIGDACA